MGLHTTSTSKCLDKKSKLLGFEMPDLFAVFFSLAILNFLFGKTDHKLLLVWLPPVIIALVLHFGKKGKPDNFLLHYIRFQFSSGTYQAFSDPTNNTPPPIIKQKGEDV